MQAQDLRINKLVEFYQNDGSIKGAMQEFGFSRRRVTQLLERHNVALRPPGFKQQNTNWKKALTTRKNIRPDSPKRRPAGLS